MTGPEIYVQLHRIDPAQNVARFYVVWVGPSLIDAIAVIRFWGRIGGTSWSRPARRRRMRRGYEIVTSTPPAATPPTDQV
jgi:hypothetical protein